MLSSVSGVVGIALQANYADRASYEDAVARWHQSQGLPGVAIDLGPISDIGYVLTSAKVAERLRKDGDFTMLDEDIVLRALNAAVLHPLGARSQIIIGLNSAPGPQWNANGRSQLGRDARFAPLQPRSKASARPADGESTGGSLTVQLAEASDRQDGAGLISAAIAAKLADIFMTPVAEIDLSKPPTHYGVDSLIAVELRNMLVLQAAADTSIFNLQTASLAALAGLVAEKSRHLQGA
ncbi:acyl transferase/acyl hydrolase/lysophospholipase [Aspergillus udagawae]|uniref:Acyl transferase/acyl hydrolase/lysophospholipase n=1 Tax=Aspergillus udagawae TaxID=91492 RepID=A0ABQ1B6X2_9EURO|nr:acyl transferase/acyl hydrolase/lysophospholipase [Aspergillus udagawae]GFG16566.1 acyl transferase/acyl hydrolase/lysophospholipase [Aspergillus udagawae]